MQSLELRGMSSRIRIYIYIYIYSNNQEDNCFNEHFGVPVNLVADHCGVIPVDMQMYQVKKFIKK